MHHKHKHEHDHKHMHMHMHMHTHTNTVAGIIEVPFLIKQMPSPMTPNCEVVALYGIAGNIKKYSEIFVGLIFGRLGPFE